MPRVAIPTAPREVFLEGSWPQVRWAKRIRADLLPDMVDHRRDLAGFLATPGLDDQASARCRARIDAIDSLLRSNSAKWWIDQRGHFAHSIIDARVRVLDAAPSGA